MVQGVKLSWNLWNGQCTHVGHVSHTKLCWILMKCSSFISFPPLSMANPSGNGNAQGSMIKTYHKCRVLEKFSHIILIQNKYYLDYKSIKLDQWILCFGIFQIGHLIPVTRFQDTDPPSTHATYGLKRLDAFLGFSNLGTAWAPMSIHSRPWNAQIRLSHGWLCCPIKLMVKRYGNPRRGILQSI